MLHFFGLESEARCLKTTIFFENLSFSWKRSSATDEETKKIGSHIALVLYSRGRRQHRRNCWRAGTLRGREGRTNKQMKMRNEIENGWTKMKDKTTIFFENLSFSWKRSSATDEETKKIGSHIALVLYSRGRRQHRRNCWRAGTLRGREGRTNKQMKMRNEIENGWTKMKYKTTIALDVSLIHPLQPSLLVHRHFYTPRSRSGRTPGAVPAAPPEPSQAHHEVKWKVA